MNIEKSVKTTRTSDHAVPSIVLVPTDKYIARHLPHKRQRVFHSSEEKTENKKNNTGYELHEQENRTYLTIFSKERIDIKPVVNNKNVSGILVINGAESYASIELRPKKMLLSLVVDTVNPGVGFEVRDIVEYIKRSNINSDNFQIVNYGRLTGIEEINFTSNGATLNFFLDRRSNISTVWSTIEHPHEQMESGIDPFMLKPNLHKDTMREMNPIDFGVMQLHNMERLMRNIQRG